MLHYDIIVAARKGERGNGELELKGGGHSDKERHGDESWRRKTEWKRLKMEIVRQTFQEEWKQNKVISTVAVYHQSGMCKKTPKQTMNILKSVSVQICLSKCLNIFEKKEANRCFFGSD